VMVTNNETRSFSLFNLYLHYLVVADLFIRVAFYAGTSAVVTPKLYASHAMIKLYEPMDSFVCSKIS
jgi:hypothetical protein